MTKGTVSRAGHVVAYSKENDEFELVETAIIDGNVTRIRVPRKEIREIEAVIEKQTKLVEKLGKDRDGKWKDVGEADEAMDKLWHLKQLRNEMLSP